MDTIDLLRFVSLCLLLAGAETLHGIARTVLLAPRIGKARAIQLSVVSGTLLAYALGWFTVPGVGATGLPGHLGLGVGLAVFMAAFDVAIGRLVMRLKWPRILQDFDPRSGNFLSIGLALLAAMPAIVWGLRTPALG